MRMVIVQQETSVTDCDQSVEEAEAKSPMTDRTDRKKVWQIRSGTAHGPRCGHVRVADVSKAVETCFLISL